MLIPLIAATMAIAPMTPPDDLDIITVEFVDLVLATPDAVPMCESYDALVSAVDGLGLDYSAATVLLDAVDAYLIINIEGDTMRLDNEARDRVVDWLHTDCM